MPARPTNQLGMDETVTENTGVEEALEEREQRRAASFAVRKAYQEAHERAVGAIAALNLEVGAVVRIGRFRITKAETPAHVVSFETEASSRIRIEADEA